MNCKSIVHRDLNPRNIFLHFEHANEVGILETAKVKIIDFNSSKCMLLTPIVFEESPITDDKLFQNDLNSGKSSPAQFELMTARVGTPMYRAPELIARSKQFSFAVDVWGIGCTLYYLLVGQPPFSPEME